MYITFRVDQAEAILRGIDAPSSTIKLDVDPATLSEIEREILSAVLVDGHDATKKGIYRSSLVKIVSNDSYERDDIVLVQPTIEGMRAAIQGVVEARQKRVIEAQEKSVKDRVDADARIDEVLRAEQKTESVLVGLTEAGTPAKDYDKKVVYRAVDVPCYPPHLEYVRKNASPEALARLQARDEEVRSARNSVIAATLEELSRGPFTDWLAAEAAKKADYDSLYARLPQTLRDRHAAGFAEQDEVDKKMRYLIIKDAGLSEFASWKGWDKYTPTQTLTDGEFDSLNAFKARLPEGATVKVLSVWDESPKLDEYGEEFRGDDGDVVKDESNYRRVVRATFDRAGIECKVTATLSVRK